jgi:hypothetical protein
VWRIWEGRTADQEGNALKVYVVHFSTFGLLIKDGQSEYPSRFSGP